MHYVASSVVASSSDYLWLHASKGRTNERTGWSSSKVQPFARSRLGLACASVLSRRRTFLKLALASEKPWLILFCWRPGLSSSSWGRSWLDASIHSQWKLSPGRKSAEISAHDVCTALMHPESTLPLLLTSLFLGWGIKYANLCIIIFDKFQIMHNFIYVVKLRVGSFLMHFLGEECSRQYGIHTMNA